MTQYRIPTSEFSLLVANEAVGRRCLEYLKGRNIDDGLLRCLPRKLKAVPHALQPAIIKILADDVDGFVRLWLVLRPGAASSKTLRRFAKRLALFMSKMLKDISEAEEAIKAMNDGALDVAQKFARETADAYVRSDPAPSAVAAGEAFYWAMSDSSYDAVARSIENLLLAHVRYGKTESEMVEVCSKQLQNLCKWLIRKAHEKKTHEAQDDGASSDSVPHGQGF